MDLAAVLTNDASADRQTESAAAFLSGVRGVDLLKAFEDQIELVRGNAASLVSDLEDDIPIGNRCGQ